MLGLEAVYDGNAYVKVKLALVDQFHLDGLGLGYTEYQGYGVDDWSVWPAVYSYKTEDQIRAYDMTMDSPSETYKRLGAQITRIVTPLPAPSNVQFNETTLTLTWDPVRKATGYMVKVGTGALGGEEYMVWDGTSFDLSTHLESGMNMISVMATPGYSWINSDSDYSLPVMYNFTGAGMNVNVVYKLDLGVHAGPNNTIELREDGDLDIMLMGDYRKVYYSLNGGAETEAVLEDFGGTFTIPRGELKAKNSLLVLVIANNGHSYSKHITVTVQE
jgi:hypothetical protein